MKSTLQTNLIRQRQGRRHSRFLRLLSSLALISCSAACATTPTIKPQQQGGAVVATTPAAGQSFSDAMAAAGANNWSEAEKSFQDAAKSSASPDDPSALTATLLAARSSLGSLQWILDGSKPSADLSDPKVQEAFKTLRKIVETPGMDPRVHYAARLYLATLYLLDHQQEEANKLLADYPSANLSPLILPQDQIPLRFMLANAFSVAGRHHDSAQAYEATLNDAVTLLHTTPTVVVAPTPEAVLSEPSSETVPADAPPPPPVAPAPSVGGASSTTAPFSRTSEGGQDATFSSATNGSTVFEDLLLNLIADEVSYFTEREWKDSITNTDSLYIRPLSVFELLKREANTDNLSDDEKQSIFQSLSQIEPELIKTGRKDELLSLRHRLSEDTGVTTVKNIGVLLPFTGPHRPYAVRAREAIMVASSGFSPNDPSLHTRTRFIFADSTEDPAAIVKKFKDNNVLAVIGPLTSERTVAFAPLLSAAHIPLLSLSATTPQNLDNKYVFRFYLNALQEAKTIAEVANKKMGDMRVAVLYTPNGYGRAMSKAFKAAFTAGGGEVVFERALDANSSNYTDLAKLVDASNPQAIFIAARPEKVAELTAFFAQQNIWGIAPNNQARVDGRGRRFVHYLGTSIWQDSPLLRQSYSYIEGALIPAWTSPLYDNGPRGKWLDAQFLSATGRVPDTFKIIAADAALLANDYLRNRKVDTPDAFRDQLINGAPFTGEAGSVRFTPNGDVERDLRLLQIKGGQVILSPIKL